jgi:hypothetical protein
MTYWAIRVMQSVGLAHSLKLPRIPQAGVAVAASPRPVLDDDAAPSSSQPRGDEEPELIEAAR